MDYFNQQQSNQWNDAFMNVINLASFLIGLQNLDLNITANDLIDQKNDILDDLHQYFTEQNIHLEEQDRHLAEQDLRMDRLERLLYEKIPYDRKENKK